MGAPTMRLMSTLLAVFVTIFANKASAHAGKLCSNYKAQIFVDETGVSFRDGDFYTVGDGTKIYTFAKAVPGEPSDPYHAEISQTFAQCVIGEKPHDSSVGGEKWYWRTTIEKLSIKKADANTGNSNLDKNLKAGIETFVLCQEQSRLSCEGTDRRGH